MGSDVKQWQSNNGVAYSVPLGNNGDDNRSAVSWIVLRWKPEAKAYHLYCIPHEGFMCDCIDRVITYRKQIGISDNRTKDE